MSLRSVASGGCCGALACELWSLGEVPIPSGLDRSRPKEGVVGSSTSDWSAVEGPSWPQRPPGGSHREDWILCRDAGCHPDGRSCCSDSQCRLPRSDPPKSPMASSRGLFAALSGVGQSQRGPVDTSCPFVSVAFRGRLMRWGLANVQSIFHVNTKPGIFGLARSPHDPLAVYFLDLNPAVANPLRQ